MDETQRLAVFKAQSINVRELELAWKHTNRQINSLLLSNQMKSVEITTKSLALIYCALAESIFSKLIHTPYGLTLDEISKIKIAAKSNVKSGWLKCAQLSVRHISVTSTTPPQDVLKNLKTLINSYIYDPSILRNKLAHGQWTVALNSQNNAVNEHTTDVIKQHNVVELYRRKQALNIMSLAIEDIIESPDKTHIRDYGKHMEDLTKKQKKLAAWTIEEKLSQLKLKKSHQYKQAK
jgi:hypothetical protein